FGGINLESYSLFNLTAAFSLTEAWQAEFRVDNLIDDKYEPVFGFNAAGRTFWAAIQWRPE
ncbi:MAG: hypothetical protein AAGH65_04580, partial [Pseudomonadota bacterium]